jgi:2-polyprenyl-3-methyl-5-hydroxy-6-metoxy-1,4-benzoquinol methylase
MDPVRQQHFGAAHGHYDANYTHFETALYEAIRREAFGEDIGQNSWLTAEEHDGIIGWLDLAPGKHVLDVACGAGGPALRLAARTGCSVVGIDSHEHAIRAAHALAQQGGLGDVARFQQADAQQPLPFLANSFDAIVCIDAINHLADRPRVIAYCHRLLTVGGRLVFTDPVVVTGPLTNAEIAVRSSIGFFLFVPPGYDERVMDDVGLRLLAREDVTANMAMIAERRCAARASRGAALREIEGEETYVAQQDFLDTASRLARERRLSRFLYVAERVR